MRLVRLRDLLLRPARHSALAAHGVRAGAEAAKAGTETSEASLLLLSCLRLLQVESGKADGAVVRAARGRAVGVGVGGVHGHAVGDVDALVVAVAELGLAGDVQAAGAGGCDFVGRAVESLCCGAGGDVLLLLALLLLVRLEVLLVLEGRRAHVGLLLGHLGLGLSSGEVEGQRVGVARVQDRRRGRALHAVLSVLAGAGTRRDRVLSTVGLEGAHR